VISQPGAAPVLLSLVVKKVEVVRTHFLTANGELLLFDNNMLKNMTVTNLSRSGPTNVMTVVKVPVVTPSEKVTELVDAICMYVGTKSTDWLSVNMLFPTTDFEAGHMELAIWTTSAHPANELGKVYGARSNMLLFIHAYMQSAGIEYLKPASPMHIKSEEMQAFMQASGAAAV